MFTFEDKYRSEILLHLIIHYGWYVLLVLFSKPETNVVTGLHEPVGPCQETVPVYTAFGHVSRCRLEWNHITGKPKYCKPTCNCRSGCQFKCCYVYLFSQLTICLTSICNEGTYSQYTRQLQIFVKKNPFELIFFFTKKYVTVQCINIQMICKWGLDWWERTVCFLPVLKCHFFT